MEVPGVDAIYVGPNDLLLSLGFPAAADSDEPLFNDTLKKIVDACHNAGVAPGIHASPQLAAKRREQGFEIITVASDFNILRDGMIESLATSKK